MPTPPADEMAAACPDFADLKAGFHFDTPRLWVDRAAFTHAMRCPTCGPIADRAREAQAARTARLAGEVRAQNVALAIGVFAQAAKIIENNGYCTTYMWDTRQESQGTPIEECRVDIIGALAIALHGSPVYSSTPRVRAAEELLAERIDAPSVAAWSTQTRRTGTDAARLLREAATALRLAHDTA